MTKQSIKIRWNRLLRRAEALLAMTVSLFLSRVE
jgi:hypothetical protein